MKRSRTFAVNCIFLQMHAMFSLTGWMEHFAVMKAPKLFMEKVIKAKVGTLQGKYKPL